MLQLGLGDVATRIVRALRVRGRVPTQMDEVIVPTVRVMDLTDPLFAQNPMTWATSVQSAPGAGVVAYVALQNPIGSLFTTIVDNIELVVTEAAADTFSFNLGRNRIAPTPVNAAVVLNQPAPSAQLAQVQSVAGTGVVGGLARNDYNLVTPGGLFVSKIIPVGAVLYPGDSLLVQSLNVGVLVTFIVNAWGRDFLAG